jgi:D-alanine transaminase
MSRIAYVNGQYQPLFEAGVHVEDRGYQFSDGVYEVIYFQNGRMIDEAGHLDRLERSLSELSIKMPMARKPLQVVMGEIIRRNGLSSGILYIQISRGVARRDHPFPPAIAPSLVMTVRRVRQLSEEAAAKGVSVITIPDIRWGRRDIKSISLLPNVLGKQQAKEAGAYEAWMIEPSGEVTEGTSTNAWIVTRQGELITHQPDHSVLNGITRQAVIALAALRQVKVVERAFTLAEAKDAAEAFITSTTCFVMPVVRIDGQAVGEGKAGRLTLELRAAYRDRIKGEQA